MPAHFFERNLSLWIPNPPNRVGNRENHGIPGVFLTLENRWLRVAMDFFPAMMNTHKIHVWKKNPTNN